VALEYQPGRPGNYTRDIAVDVTELHNVNGKASFENFKRRVGAVEATSRLRIPANEWRNE
jgi:hypothetical protein